MMTDLDQLIDELADDAAPVTRQDGRIGRIVLAALALAGVGALAALYGLRPDVLAMRAPIAIMLAIGLMILLGAAAGGQAIRMARPQVGAPSSAAPWLVAALGLFPLLALAALAGDPAAAAGLDPETGQRCLGVGIACGAASLAFLGLWLHRGAPVAPERAAWLAGLAAGAIGAAAVTMECGHDEIVHLGLWHVAVVAALALAGRAVLPRFIRW